MHAVVEAVMLQKGNGMLVRTCFIWLSMLLIAGCSSSIDLLSGLPEQEANESLSVLLAVNIKAEKMAAKTGITLRISSSDLAAALAALREHGLPHERYARMGDVFKKENLVSSPLEERARYLFALSQELEMTLSQIDGVLVARVQVVLSEQSSAVEPLTPASASVFLKYRPGTRLQPLLPQIRSLVASSVPGLSEDRVSVALVPAADGIAHLAPSSADAASSNAADRPGNRRGRPPLTWLLAGLAVLVAAASVTWRWRSSRSGE